MKVAIVGSGNVGKAVGKALVVHKHDVTFYDVVESQLLPLVAAGYSTTMNLGSIVSSDVIFVCVPTEALPNGDCDMHIYNEVMNKLHFLGYEGLVVQMSTCPPLTARKYSELLSNYVVCPSHYQMSRMEEDALHPVRLNIGTSDGKPNSVMAELFRDFDGPMFFMSYEQAELTKYVENALASNIVTFWNEVFLLAEYMDKKGYSIDTDRMARIINIAPCWRSVYRFHGKAFSGICLPKDLHAYINWSKENLDYVPRIAEAVRQVNEEMKQRFGEETKHSSYSV